jgi:hypothetical protein
VVRAQLGALVAGSPSGVPKSQSQHALLCCNEIAERRAGSTEPSAPQKPTQRRWIVEVSELVGASLGRFSTTLVMTLVKAPVSLAFTRREFADQFSCVHVHVSLPSQHDAQTPVPRRHKRTGPP